MAFRMLLRVMLAIWLASLGLVPGLAQAAKESRAERYEVNLEILGDGSLRVTETVIMAYSGGPFSWVSRDVPLARTDGAVEVAAYMDGVRLTTGTGPGQVDIESADWLRVTWHFAELSDTTRTFELRYLVLGATRQESTADTLAWQAFPVEHEYAIDTARIFLIGPAGLEPTRPPETSGIVAARQLTRGGWEWSAQNLAPNDSLRLDVRFPAGSLLDAPPAWQAEAQAAAARSAQTLPIMAGLALAILVLGTTVLLSLWRRQQQPSVSGVLRLGTPPSDLAPALAGVLAARGAGPNPAHALGTVFDLARRGVLTISEKPRASRLEPKEYLGVLARVPAELRPHERAILTALFGAQARPGATSRLRQRMTWLTYYWPDFAEPVRAEIAASGWFDPARQRARRTWMASSLALMGLALALGLAALLLGSVWGQAALLMPLSMALVSGLGLSLAARLAPLSSLGQHEALRWGAFARYLRDLTQQRLPLTRTELLEQYLPYATALGLAADWARLSQRQGWRAAPAWFEPATSGGDGGFLAMIMATSAGAGSGDGGASAAASAAAGGGASATG